MAAELSDMPRLLATSFIALALIVGAAGVTHAQSVDPNADPYGGDTAAAAADLQTAGASSTVDPAAQKAVTENKTSTDEAYNGIMTKIMSLFAWLVGVAAITLDNAVYYTVVTMGDYVNKLSAIGVTWRILRDIGNIMLIFGFLAVGITTILNVDWYGGGKKMLPMMLVAAVFLNFSLFISEALIDTSNLFATQFYQQINGGNPAGAKNFDIKSVTTDGIANKIMGQLGMQAIYGKAITNTAVFQGGSPWFIGFMGIILFIITAFVLFSLAFVLISRFVILIFLIILSPAAFAGLAIPGLKTRMMSWWDKLFEQVMTAPVLLLMLYVALAVITDAQFLTGFCIPPAGSTDACRPDWLGFIASGGSTGNNLVGFGSMMMSFLVAMGLLMAVVIQSKNLSAFGASQAMKVASWPGRVAARYATGYAGLGLQRLNSRIRSTRTGRVLGRVASVATLGALSDYTVNKATGQMQQAKFGTASSVDDRRKFAQRRRGELGVDLEGAVRAGDAAEVRRILGGMSTADLARSRYVQNAEPIVMQNLPQNRFEDALRHEDMPQSRRTQLLVQRTAAIRAQYANTPHPDPRFGGRTLADITLNGAPAGPGGVPPAIRSLSSAQRAAIDSGILAQPHVMDLLTVSDFAAIARRGELEAGDQRNVGIHLTGLALADPRSAQIAALAATNRSFAAYFGIP